MGEFFKLFKDYVRKLFVEVYVMVQFSSQKTLPITQV